MLIKASLKHLRIAPRKTRLVVDLIRNSSLEAAEKQLQFLNKKAAIPVLKLLKSAAANAKNNFKIEDKKSLFIKDISVDEGPHVFKRWRPRAMGRAFPILKRGSHINLILEARGIKEKKGKKTKIEIVEAKTMPKIVKEEARPIIKDIKQETQSINQENDRHSDKGQLPERPYSSSSASKKRRISKQWLGSLNKRFFRRKSV